MMEFFKKIEARIQQYRLLKKPNTNHWKEPRTTGQDNHIRYIFKGDSLETLRLKIALKKNAIFQDFSPGHRVLIKINLNSSHPYPASTDPDMLGAVIDLLREHGLVKIWVGDCSSMGYLPTRQVVKKTAIDTVIKGKATFKAFDEERWVKIAVNGIYLKQITVPECLYEADRIINLANLKTHGLADFSMGIKLLVGFMHPFERYELHHHHLQEKIGEMGSVIQPDLSIIDARKAFITGGPDEGRAVPGNRVFIGSNLVQTDIEAYDFLCSLKQAHGCIGHFTKDPFCMLQFKGFPQESLPRQSWTLL